MRPTRGRYKDYSLTRTWLTHFTVDSETWVGINTLGTPKDHLKFLHVLSLCKKIFKIIKYLSFIKPIIISESIHVCTFLVIPIFYYKFSIRGTKKLVNDFFLSLGKMISKIFKYQSLIKPIIIRVSIHVCTFLVIPIFYHQFPNRGTKPASGFAFTLA